MAATPVLTTGGTDLVKLQKKVQGDVLWRVMRETPEWGLMRSAPSSDLTHSKREVTQVVVLSEQGGGAFIPEFGFEARAKTLAPPELTYTYAQYNARFSVSTLSRQLSGMDKAAFLQDQIRFQVMRQSQGLSRRFSQTVYGLSSGLLCKTSTDATASTQTLTLIDAYGQTESAADNPAFLAGMFSVGDTIAVVRSGAIITNGIGTITAKSASAGTLTVTMIGSANVDANDEIYFAESVENDPASATSCDLNQWPVGLVDARETTTFHSLSSATVPEWAAGSDSSGGRFNGTRCKVGKHFIENKGGKGPFWFIQSQGVERDIYNQQVAAVRFADPMNMTIDGDVNIGQRITPFTSKYVPNGFAALLPKKNIMKWPLTPLPDIETGEMPDFQDATEVDKVADRAGHYVSLDLTWGNILHRNHFYFWKGLTES